MQLGGWWRLWIALSILWSITVLALMLNDRPTQDSVSELVGFTCNLDEAVSEELAADVAQMPRLAKEFLAAKDDAGRKAIGRKLIDTRNAVSLTSATPQKYQLNRVESPDGVIHAVISATDAPDSEVFEQVQVERYKLNTWTKHGDYCAELLKSHSAGTAYRERRNSWALGTTAGALSIPIITLLLGLAIGWIWRGFRPKAKDAA